MSGDVPDSTGIVQFDREVNDRPNKKSIRRNMWFGSYRGARNTVINMCRSL